ncbi:hypothetical protein [Variovorax sp. HJSM1_2]
MHFSSLLLFAILSAWLYACHVANRALSNAAMRPDVRTKPPQADTRNR